jgi:hypothetical protein
MRSRSTRVLAVLVAVFAVSAVASAAASAAPEWQINGKPLTGSHEVKVTFSKLEIGDLNHPGGAVVLECGAKATGTLSPTKDEIKSFELATCKFVAGKNGACNATKLITASYLGLPWSMELYEEGGKVKDRLKGAAGKALGYSWECTEGVFGNEDTCTTLEASSLMSNVLPNVDAEFGSSKLSCTKGTSTSGLFEGIGIYKTTNPSTEHLTVT